MTGLARVPPAWKSRWWWWALPLAFSILNGVYLWMHREATSDFGQLQDELARQVRLSTTLEQQRDRYSALLATAESNRAGVAELYESRLATEAVRLTEVIAEVKGLARRANLEPRSISYSEVDIEEHGLIQKSIVFGVEGSYSEIRQMINLLEISEMFLILEEIRLRETAGETLGIDLVVSTLFAKAPSSNHASADAGETS